MNIFTNEHKESNEAITEDWKNDILTNILTGGTAIKTVNHIIGGNLSHVLNLNSGSARLHTNVIKRFALIINQPQKLSHLNQYQIRCCLCNQVIFQYPCWYYEVKYAVNHFHYFLCFDSSSADKPSTKCYRKSI